MMLSKSSGVRKKLSVAVLVMAQTVAVSVLPALAQEASVRVAGKQAFGNIAAGGGLSATNRADTIQRNLDNALVAASDKSPQAVQIVYVKGTPVITLGGYQVATVSAADAQLAGTTTAVLAQRWATNLKSSLNDAQSVNSYVAQLTGGDVPSAVPAVASSYQPSNNYQPVNYGNNLAQGQYGNQYQYGNQQYAPPPQYGGQQYAAPQQSYGAPGQYQRGRVSFAPAGLTLPVTLSTSISTQIAKPGDLVQATLNNNVDLGGSVIPAGSAVIGQISNAKSGGFLGRSGMLTIQFNRLRTPDGVETPISSHIVGGIGKYSAVGGQDSSTYKGEGMGTKAGQAAIRTGVGAGLGAGLGTAIGAIAGHGGRGAGRGAWSGAAIGGGLGLADSLLLRKGKDVVIAGGTQLQVQLDAAATIGGAGVPPYTGAF